MLLLPSQSLTCLPRAQSMLAVSTQGTPLSVLQEPPAGG